MSMFRRPPGGRLARKRSSAEPAVSTVLLPPLPDVAAAPPSEKKQAESSSPVGGGGADPTEKEGLLDTRLAPAVKPRVIRRSDTLSRFLQVAGNARAWETMAQSIRGAPHRAILLHGPTGCGKTRGVFDLANNCLGMTVSELNATSVYGTDEFRRKIVGVTGSRTLLGPRIVLIEDIEGFEESYIATLAKILKERREDSGPMVITCRNPFDRTLLCFRTLDLQQVRLFSPSKSQLVEAVKLVRQDMTESVIAHHAEHANGNFHQIFIRLKTFINSAPDAHVGLFETTQQLLTGNAGAEEWTRSAEPHILTTLLYENYPTIYIEKEGNDDNWHTFSEVLSETRTMPDDYALTCVAMTAMQRLRISRPPPLRLPKRARPPLSSASPYERDVPALLRGT